MTRGTSTLSSTTPSTCRWPASPACARVTLRISSAGKTFSATGGRSAGPWGRRRVVTSRDRSQAVPDLRVRRALQTRVARALNEGDEWVAGLGRSFKTTAHGGRRPATVGLEPHIPRGTYFRTPTYARWVTPTASSSARPAGALRGWWPSHTGFYDRRGGRPAVQCGGRSASRTRCGPGHHPVGAAQRGPHTGTS